MKQNPKVVLYIDDDEDDREFLLEAFKEVNPEVEVVLVENGVKALDYLNTAKSNQTTLPNLIILDLNMPYLDGFQTFQRIKQEPELQSVPIVVFTSSENPKDKAMFKKLGVELITKPDNIIYMNQIASHMLSSCG